MQQKILLQRKLDQDVMVDIVSASKEDQANSWRTGMAITHER